jgi:hypothetical protein
LTGETKRDFYQSAILKDVREIVVNIREEKTYSKYQRTPPLLPNRVELLSTHDKSDHEINDIETDGFVKVICKILSFATLNDPHYGFIIRDKYGSDIYGVSTASLNITTSPHYKGEIVTAICSLHLPLSPGDYSICFGVANGACDLGVFEEYCLFIQDVAMIKIIQKSEKPRFGGLVNLNAKMDINKELNKQNIE